MLMHGRKVGVVLSFAPSRFPLFQQEIPAGGTEDAIHAEVVVSLHPAQTGLHLGAEQLVAAPDFIRVIALVLHQQHGGPDVIALHATAQHTQFHVDRLLLHRRCGCGLGLLVQQRLDAGLERLPLRIVLPCHLPGAGLPGHVVVPQDVGVHAGDAQQLAQLRRQCRSVGLGALGNMVVPGAAHLDGDTVGVAAEGMYRIGRAYRPRPVTGRYGLVDAVLIHKVVCAGLPVAACKILAVGLGGVADVARVVQHHKGHVPPAQPVIGLRAGRDAGVDGDTARLGNGICGSDALAHISLPLAQLLDSLIDAGGRQTADDTHGNGGPAGKSGMGAR